MPVACWAEDTPRTAAAAGKIVEALGLAIDIAESQGA